MTTDSHLLQVAAIVDETADARSITVAVPDELADRFALSPGQPLTPRCPVRPHRPGRALPPSGDLHAEGPVGGPAAPRRRSGTTPIMSIVRAALAHRSGRVVLPYANRDERSVIFAGALAELAAEHPERLQVVHWLDSVQGLPSESQQRTVASTYAFWTSFCCGPAPFTKAVAQALRSLEFPRARRHQERSVSLDGNRSATSTRCGPHGPRSTEAYDPDDPDDPAQEPTPGLRTGDLRP